jgi:hypothetical protein
VGVASGAGSAGALRYIESFENPYVKIILVCKQCNKEMNMKRTDTWKVHYYTHVSNDNMPFKCQYCAQGFVLPNQLNRHVQKKHANNLSTGSLKEEPTYIE